MTPADTSGTKGRLGALSDRVKALRERVREGGGRELIEERHETGKLTARERVGLLLDPSEPRFELGLHLSTDGPGEQVSAAGVVTCVGRVAGREMVTVASDATAGSGGWRPETIQKILRAQEVAMRCRIPIVYLLDAEGADPPVQGRVFPGQYGAGRVLYYAAVMRRHLDTTQIAAVMGPCTGSAAYLPALSDLILMVEGRSFMGLGGPDLVRRATGGEVSAERLGGAEVHTASSGVAHYRVESDAACIERVRQLIGELPDRGETSRLRVPTPPLRLPYELYDLIPDDPREPYDMRAALECVLDGDALEEFQPEHAREMICGTAYIEGIHVGVIANARGLVPSQDDRPPRFGGLLYAESARKVAYFIEALNRQGTPLVFVHDVSGFMVGPESEHAGILRAGAEMLEATATADVPKIAVTLNHASGAGYYAMAGQGLDPDFVISLPTGQLGVGTEGDVGPVDALRAAAAGFVDEILLPEELRPALGLLLRSALHNSGPHLGPFQVGKG